MSSTHTESKSPLQWLEQIKELVLGLGYLSRLADVYNLQTPGQILRIATQDIGVWASNNSPTPLGKWRLADQLVADPDFRAAVDFLDMFSHCTNGKLKREIVRAIEDIRKLERQKMI